MWHLKKRRFGKTMDHRKEFKAPYSRLSSASTQSSKSTLSMKQSVTGHRSTEVVIDIDTELYVQQPAQSPTKSNRHTTTIEDAPIRISLIPLAFLICQFAFGLLLSVDMSMADGMRPYAVTTFLITTLGGLIGLYAELTPTPEKRTDEMDPIMWSSIIADILPSIVMTTIMRYGPNCAYLISMCVWRSATAWLLLVTLLSSIRKCFVAIKHSENAKGHIESFIPLYFGLPLFSTYLCILTLFMQPQYLMNGDCTLDIATFRITANTVYPIVADCNSTEPRFVQYPLETMLEANFSTVGLVKSKQMLNITADCRRLAGFDQFVGMTERDEYCTLTASTTNPNHDDGDQALEFSLSILIGSSGGAVRTVPYCQQDDERGYHPNPYELQKLFRAYCRIGSDEMVYECPSIMKTEIQLDESPIAWFDCTRPCYAQPSVDHRMKQPTIRFKQLAGRLIIGDRQYELKYKESPMCW